LSLIYISAVNYDEIIVIGFPSITSYATFETTWAAFRNGEIYECEEQVKACRGLMVRGSQNIVSLNRVLRNFRVFRKVRKDRKLRKRFRTYRMFANLDAGWSAFTPLCDCNNKDQGFCLAKNAQSHQG
jgi:hypothetical protein